MRALAAVVAPHRRALLSGLAALLGAAAQAQPAPPAGDPPAPPELSPSTRPPQAPPQPPAARSGMPPSFTGLSNLPEGGWRLGFEPGVETLSAPQRLGLTRLGGALARETTGRVTLWAEVAGGEDVSMTRRLALRRAVAVRSVLVAGGLPETRVDIRALGRTEAERDVVDILPFGVTRD